MKICLRNTKGFSQEARSFYKDNFEFADEKDADVIVINDFSPANYPDKIVAFNATCPDNVTAKEIISLRGEDLSDLTAVAELCLSMAIYTTRIFKQEEVRGKTLGLIGYGRIARQLQKMAHGLGMKTMVFDNANGTSSTVVYDRLETLLPNSDIISLHITANEKNRGFMNRAKFEMMKDGAIFLNSSRGFLVEKEALKLALESGKIGGSWSDFDTGFTHPNLVVTPHLGGSTKESRKKSEMIIAKKLYAISKNDRGIV